MKKRIIFNPGSAINPFGGGGEKRSTQINELLLEHFDFINISNKNILFSRFKRLKKAFYAAVFFGVKIRKLKDFTLLGYYYLNCEKIVETHALKKPLLVWESTISNYYYLPFFYKKLGCKLVAFPVNIDALVPNEIPHKGLNAKTYLLEYDLEQLRLCEHVFTISEEEHWLLSLNNIKSTYFPYYPNKILEKTLLTIRAQRKKDMLGDFYLMFGSFFYEPTKMGLLEILKPLNIIDAKVVITGYGAENIFNTLDFSLNPHIKYIGMSTLDELNQLLKTCKGVIINQVLSSGALTKLKELQIAGVPVILNTDSTRSFKNVHGFNVYRTINELKEFVVKDLPMPNLPEDNSFYENRAVQIIKEIYNK
jgi:hypothetical protein